MIRAKVKTTKKSSVKRELKKRLLSANRRSVKVGYPAGGTLKSGSNTNSKKETEQVTFAKVIEYAAYNHFGTRDGRIPSRPFMSVAFEGLRKTKLKRAIKKESALLISPQHVESVDSSFRRLGVLGVSLIQEAITGIESPENADSTKARKKSSNPLIDTGRMRQSVQYELSREI